jgi:hypothetical protein
LKYTVEKEEDMAHIQQVSGGFGDTTHLDDEAIKILVKQQREQELRNKAN